MRLRLVVVAGPTAIGKTRVAVELAHRLGAEILSADSRQVYRGLDIASGKDLDEYRAVDPPVPVHLVDLVDPTEVYSLFRYQRDCYRILAEKARAGIPLVMAGGTGLYVEAVLRGYRIPNVPADPELRERLSGRSLEELDALLREEDPDEWARADRSTSRRVVRGIEIARSRRRRPVEYSAPPPVELAASVHVLTLPTEALARRIERRLDERLEQGMVEEVARLRASGVSRERMRELGLECREVDALLAGEKTREEMREDLLRGIRAFARKQRTWFRGCPRRGLPARYHDATEEDLARRLAAQSVQCAS